MSSAGVRAGGRFLVGVARGSGPRRSVAQGPFRAGSSAGGPPRTAGTSPDIAVGDRRSAVPGLAITASGRERRIRRRHIAAGDMLASVQSNVRSELPGSMVTIARGDIRATSACRRLRTRPGGGGSSAPLPGRPARSRRGRTGAAGAGSRVPSGNEPRSSRPYAACRTRVRLRWSTVSSARPKPGTAATGPRRRRGPREDPGRPPRDRVRGGRHGRSGPGRSNPPRPAESGPASRRHHPPAGPWSGSMSGGSSTVAGSQTALIRGRIRACTGLSEAQWRPDPVRPARTPVMPGRPGRTPPRRPSPA